MVSMNADPLACLGDVEGGGQSVIIDCLSRALSVLGHRISIYARRDRPSLPPRVSTAAGVQIEYVDTGPMQSGAPPAVLDAIHAFTARLAADWAVDGPDVVHAYSWMSGKAAVAAARPYGIPVVQSFHGLGQRVTRRRGDAGNGDATPARLDEEAALVRAVARIVAMSSAEVFALLGMGANPSAIRLVPCGVDLDVFAPAAAGAPRTREPFRVATLSRLCAPEGVADVIDALCLVDGAELIVGGGKCSGAELAADPDARALEARAHARGVAHRVSFRGRVQRDEVAPFLRSADVVVCAPQHNSAGTVALEAMACGVPVIVSAVGGLVDAVVDGMTGIHVPPQAPRQLAYAIEALKSDPARRERFGRFGSERTSARYGWSRIASETFEVYRSVAARSAMTTRSRA
jgi:D-inositol-3-phosphate glycosyltransferase